MQKSMRELRSLLITWLILTGVARVNAATVTATFENYGGGAFLGFAPVTDPASGITFNNINPYGGLGACLFTDPNMNLPSLYRNNVVLEQNVPQGSVFWSTDFSIHGLLPQPASSMSVDVLYDFDMIADPRGPSGTVTLEGFDANGHLVGSVSTPPLTLEAQQTHLSFSFASPISSFSVVADNVSTDYDNISFTTVPEPTACSVILMGAFLLLRRVEGQKRGRRCALRPHSIALT
jgi:hypothetical protein